MQTKRTHHNKWQTLILAILLLGTSFYAENASASQDISGQYWSKKRDVIIKIFRQEHELKGQVVWTDRPRYDEKNPDESLRSRPFVGVVFLNGFTYRKENKRWEGGSVYALDNGKTYQGKIWLEEGGDILKMRGFIGVSLLGRTATFTRAKPDEEIR